MDTFITHGKNTESLPSATFLLMPQPSGEGYLPHTDNEGVDTPHTQTHTDITAPTATAQKLQGSIE